MASHFDLINSLIMECNIHIRPILLIAVVSVVCVWLVRRLASPLNKYPGPTLAAWTNWYRFYLVLTGRYHLRMKELHERYGPVVRIGPNTLDLDHPELIKTIYSVSNGWLKTDFYHANSIKVGGNIVYTMFSTPSNEDNLVMKRPIARHYSPGAALALEPLLDGVIGQFCDELDRRFVETSSICDLGAWIAYCIWDMVGAASFSKDFGYLERGCDFDGTIGIADKALDYFAAVGQMPFLDYLLDKNPLYPVGPPSLGNITRVALERIAERVGDEDGHRCRRDKAVPDYLDHFLEARRRDPGLVDDGMLLGYLFINLVAGADTTALTVRAVVYFLLKNPRAHARVRAEVRAARLGRVVKYSEARALPYLDAVVRESMRLHPGVSMMLERYVPPGGLQLPDGSVVPAGTSVGLNAFITHRNRAVYGPDADVFRPERWLRAEGEPDDAYQKRMKLYAKYDLTFGAGPRICLGRHVAIIKTYKVVATLLSNYDVELDRPDREWQVHCGWFLRQYGIICRLNKVQ